MNNTQLYLTIGIPTLTVILAWLSNRSDINRLNDKMDRLGDTLRGEIDKMGNSLRAEMIAFRREVHEDLLMLHERVVKVETRQGL
ncbi:MAG TPA: hypothetical protein VFC39_12835 [Acidobacteriaceae bacterium]|nr:hypothetical protein [Acidobacteriaceae bacterium]